MTGHLARALIEDLDDQALDELARLLAPRLAASAVPTHDCEDLLSPATAAERLAVSRRTIYRALPEELPARKVRGVWRIRPEDLDRWARRAPAERRRRSRRPAGRAAESTNQAVAAITGAT